MNSKTSYYQSLPQKRMGSGCLFFNAAGQVLLVEPTYKPGWEIPGGIVEDNESPKAACQREVKEELGLDLSIGRLLVLDYNEPEGDKTESLMFVFEGGTLDPAAIQSIRLQEHELKSFAFFTPGQLPDSMTSTLKARVELAIQQSQTKHTIYCENQKGADDESEI